jgi:hypothetical protein
MKRVSAATANNSGPHLLLLPMRMRLVVRPMTIKPPRCLSRSNSSVTECASVREISGRRRDHRPE